MAVLKEGQAIPTKEEQEAALSKQKSQLDEERELHRKMRSSKTAEYARDKKETTEETEEAPTE